MTAIAWDGAYFVADKQGQNSDIKITTTKAFVNKKGDMVCGISGYADNILTLRDWAFNTNMNPKKFPIFNRKDDGSVLTVVKREKNAFKIYRFEGEATPVIIEDRLYAAGSGRDVCLGAMHHGADARVAVFIAHDVCTTVGEDQTVFKWDDDFKRFMGVIG